MAILSGREFFQELRKHADKFYIIHYSCESLYDENEALSPRITSIAVTHYLSEQTISCSTHAIAEELHIPREQIPDRLDEIEKALLKKFYDFVRERRDKYWVHWNMRNLTFGFEHLEHRYRVLGCFDASVIPVERRINLNDMLADYYGYKYAPHPKMLKLMEMNGGVHRHFLDGKQEVEAFKAQEYIKMHNSTLSKVGFYHLVMRRVLRGKLKTAISSVGAFVDRLFETRTAKAIGLVSGVLGILTVVWQAPTAWSWLKKTVSSSEAAVSNTVVPAPPVGNVR